MQKHEKIVLLAKSKIGGIEVLIYKVLINSVISHDDFGLINNAVKEYKTKKMKNLRAWSSLLKISQIYKTMLSYPLKCRRLKESKSPKFSRTINGGIMLLSKCAIIINWNLSKSKKLVHY